MGNRYGKTVTGPCAIFPPLLEGFSSLGPFDYVREPYARRKSEVNLSDRENVVRRAFFATFFQFVAGGVESTRGRLGRELVNGPLNRRALGIIVSLFTSIRVIHRICEGG
jgi:hypothetical protein